jgi:hypothetical protein
MCFYVTWPMVLSFQDIDFYTGFGFICTALFLMPLQGFLNFIVYTRQRILRCMKEYYMALSSLRVFGFKSLAASSVTATGVTATSVIRQHELTERNSSKHSVAASETGSGTGQAEKQTVDRNCGPSFG